MYHKRRNFLKKVSLAGLAIGTGDWLHGADEGERQLPGTFGKEPQLHRRFLK
jgi:hypothetical protein